MRILDLPIEDQKILHSDAEQLIEEVASQYSFPFLPVDFPEPDELDLDSLGYNGEHWEWDFNRETMILTVPVEDEATFAQIPLHEILEMRRRNLVNETRVSPAADNDAERCIQKVVADCGFGTNIRKIVAEAYAQGLRKCWGARPSCGATDVLEKYGVDLDLEISSIAFEDANGDRIEVLYLGPGTTDIEFVHHATSVIATSDDFQMQMFDVNDL